MRLIFNRFFLIFIILILVSGCATYDKQINYPPSSAVITENQSIEHRFYLLGDGGSEKGENQTLLQVKDSLKKESNPSTVLFLGDNIYPRGMPEKDSKKRKKAEKILQSQVDAVKDFKGQILFIPGNHDWYGKGVEGLKRQEKYIEKQLGKNTFQPENGCPIEKVDISSNIILLIIDSQWYITNWDKHPTINNECDIQSKSQFLKEIQSEIKKARGKTTLIAIHHPLFSNGQHGGQYSFKDHMTPLPVIGTIKNVLRRTTGVVNADMSNTHYNNLRKKLSVMAKQNEKVIFVSGHEHSLQYIVQDDITQIVSGSASKRTPTHLPMNNQFSYGENGYAVLDVYKDGSSSVRFITKDKIEYQTVVYESDTINIKQSYHPVGKEQVSKAIYSQEEVTKGKWHRALWGRRYRSKYGIPTGAKVSYLDTLKGGLIPFRKGGGMQSNSLHLKDMSGKRYVLRALRKDATQLLQGSMFQDEYIQPELENSTLDKMIMDIFTGAYPYAFLTISTLSDAIGLAHLNPELLYVPKQNALGKFNTEFGDELYLFEEHASDGHQNLGGEGFTGSIINTEDMFNKVESDESVMVDEEAFLKARLFDMLIGDWDRHQDQWRWMEYEYNNKQIYKPLPRDRDQAFSKMSDGLLFRAAWGFLPLSVKRMRSYEASIKNIKSANVTSIPLDHTIFETMDKSCWDRQVAYIQEHITDEVIDSAFEHIPRELQDKTVKTIISTLKERRENLPDIANRYYNYLSKNRIEKSTNKDDYIRINARPNGTVELSFSRIKKGEIEQPFYQDTFTTEQTKELWIYGLGDKDIFEVVGKSKKIKIRLIGGQDDDTYIVDRNKNIFIYDFKSKTNNVEKAQGATLKLRDHYEQNIYDYNKYKYNFNQVLPKLAYNPDAGIISGLSYIHTLYGFERNPFTSQHRIDASYFSATSGFEVQYQGEFANIFNQTNLFINASYNTPKFSINFFGFGNETENSDDELGLDFNRTLLEQFVLNPSLKWRTYGGASITAGVKYSNIKVENTPDRITAVDSQLSDSIFDNKEFGTIRTIFSFENKDNQVFPTIGISTNIETGFTQHLSQNERKFFYLIPELSFDYKLIPSGKLVFATQLKAHLNFSNDFEFYQAASIGGDEGLRGFRNQRFTGKQSFFQSSDIRYAMGALENNIIPVQYGFFAGFDYGRVWVENDISNKWHISQGGGLFLNTAEKLATSVGIFHANEGMRFYFKMGFDF